MSKNSDTAEKRLARMGIQLPEALTLFTKLVRNLSSAEFI